MRRILTSILVFTLGWFSSNAQIKNLYLTCDPADFQFIYDNWQDDIYIPAQLQYESTVWNNISIRIRGDGSRQYPKKSLKVRFNEGAYIDGRTSINLNAEWEDQSYIQQFMASRLMQESGQVCFNTEHVRLHLNGEFFGLYLLIEAVDERFYSIRGMNPNGPTYKAALDGSSLSIFDQPQYHWEQKTGPDVNFADLQEFIDELNDAPQASFGDYVDETFVREEVVNIIAMNILLSLGSTYYHNYFMYHNPDDDKWMMLPWDMDKTLLYYGAGFPYHRSSRPWEPDNPYHEKAIHDPQLLSEIRARIVQLESTIFNLSYIQPIIDSIETVIAPSVLEDETDDIETNAFWTGKISDYLSQFNNSPGNSLGQIDQRPRNFTVERVFVADPEEQVTVHWTPSQSPVSNPISYRFFLSDDPNVESAPLILQSNITDTLFTFTAPANEGQYWYKVQSYDGFNYVDGFDTYNPLIVTSNTPQLVINEINYNSSAELATGDWVEIHNPLNYAVNLGGWYIQDNQNDHTFTFPETAELEPGGFLIAARDTAAFNSLISIDANVYGGMDFGFGNSGDVVRLYHPSGVLIDEVTYSDTLPWPVAADGTGATLELMNPAYDNEDPNNWAAWTDRFGTPGARNYQSTSVDEQSLDFGLKLYPNPVTSEEFYLTYNVTESTRVEVRIFDALGKLVFARAISAIAGMNATTLRPNLTSNGIYTLQLTSGESQTATKFVVNQP